MGPSRRGSGKGWCCEAGLASKMAPAVKGLKSLVWQSECRVLFRAPFPLPPGLGAAWGRSVAGGAGRPGAFAAAAEAPPSRSPACWGRVSPDR